MSGTTPQRTAWQFLQRHSNSVAAVLSNAIAAGSSFALQLVAARTLGATGLGRFSLLTAILITVTAVQSGWIGDSLTVLDRFSAPIRAALLRSQQVAVAVALVVGAAVAAFRITSPGVAIVFGCALALWLLEDSGRRILMARREFWQSVLNDTTYAIAALSFLIGAAVTGHEVTLGTLVWSMAVGSGVATLAVVLQLPSQELVPPSRGTRADMVGLSRFAVWRAAQIGIRPSALFLMRAIIAASFSTAALGRLEAARLLLAPVLVVVNGAGFVLLPTYTDRVRQGTLDVRKVRNAMVALGALGVAAGAAALLAAGWVGPLVTGGSFEVAPLAVLSWTLLVAGFGAGIPAGLAVVASGHPRRTFLVRAADSTVGLLGVALIVAAGAPELAPAGLAVGTFVGAAWLLRDLRSRAPAPPDVR